MDEKINDMVYYSTNHYCNDIMSFVKVLKMNNVEYIEYSIVKNFLKKRIEFLPLKN